MKGTYRAYALSIKNLQLDFISVYFAKFYENKKKTHALQNGGKFDYLGLKLENSLADP